MNGYLLPGYRLQDFDSLPLPIDLYQSFLVQLPTDLSSCYDSTDLSDLCPVHHGQGIHHDNYTPPSAGPAFQGGTIRRSDGPLSAPVLLPIA